MREGILLANNSSIGHDLISQGGRNIVLGVAQYQFFSDPPAGPVKIGDALSMTFTADSYFGGFTVCGHLIL